MRARDPVFLALSSALLLTAVACTVISLDWLGRSFPGFLLLENRVVASAGLSHWPGIRGGEIYQYEVVAVDGRPLSRASALREYVEALPEGTPVRYRLRKGGQEIERSIATRRFETRDWSLLFGLYLLNGLTVGGVALCIRVLRGGDRVATGTVLPLWIVAMWAFTAMDLYGPYRLFRAHALCETLLFAGVAHIALVFPRPPGWIDAHPRWLLAPYALAVGLAVAGQWGLGSPPLYVATHQLATAAFGLALVGLIGSQIAHYLFSPFFEVRQRVKVVALGTALALGPQALLALGSALTGGRTSQNLMAYTGMLFPLSIGYALTRHNLLGVDELVRRSLNYGLLSLALAVAYAAALALARGVLGAQPGAPLTLTFLFLSAIVLLPLHERVQRLVDRIFFRASYDFRRIVERASETMASATETRVISRELAGAVEEALHAEWNALYARRDDGEPFEPLGDPVPGGVDPERLLRELATAAQPVAAEPRLLGVPVRADGKLVAALILGPRRSGGPYGGEDRRLLQTLANQASVAIQRALVLERLRGMNRELESRVDERTAALNSALAELREKNEQLTRLSTRDGLTGLHNRAYLDGALEREFARASRGAGGLSLLMIDIDHFKQVNDRHGHPAGDRVLRSVARILGRNLRASDVVGRFGGEEFMALLCHAPDSRPDGTLPERLRAEVEELDFEAGPGRRFSVTVSIGVATFAGEHDAPEALLADADRALYRAKREGRNRVVAA